MLRCLLYFMGMKNQTAVTRAFNRHAIEGRRRELRMSRAALGDAIRRHGNTLGKWESGASVPTATDLLALAGALEVDINFFYRPYTLEGQTYYPIRRRPVATCSCGLTDYADEMAGLPSERAMCKDCAQHADFLIEEARDERDTRSSYDPRRSPQ